MVVIRCSVAVDDCTVQLSALQSETDRKLFEDTKAEAEKGDAVAQVTLAKMYVTGKGVAKDPTKSAKWMLKPAEKGLADAQYGLGEFYARGIGVKQDYAEAVKWLRKAAEQGHASAQSLLGLCYFGGDGVMKDYVEADKWFNLASAQANEPAKKSLLIVEKQIFTPVFWL